MAWLAQAASLLRDVILRQDWLGAWRSVIVGWPDWVLLVPAPAVIIAVAVAFVGKRRSRKPRAKPQARPRRPSARTPPIEAYAPAAEEQTADADDQYAWPESHEAEGSDSRSVRVFVSSTFLDMQAERHELVTKTFPALRAKYRARGVEVFEVDLRWGITRVQQQRGETLPILLTEIDRCRPYFIGLLGDRFGWVPPEEALTERLCTHFPALRDAKGLSVTAIEVMHGVLHNEGTAQRAMFFERDPGWDWVSTLPDADKASVRAETKPSTAKLTEFKATIREKAHVASYAMPAEIGHKVFEALDSLLEDRFPEADAIDDRFERSARLHKAYARERRTLHIGAETYFQKLDEIVFGSPGAQVLITGVSGGGKSTLIANWADAWCRKHPNDVLIEHYLGASPDSADPLQVMRRLWEHLPGATDETAGPPAGDLMTLSAALTERLVRARTAATNLGAQIIIALDGLDKLSSESSLRWLPRVSGVTIVASSLDGEAKTAALSRGFSAIDIAPLTPEQRQQFIIRTLGRWRRSLEPADVSRILNPLAKDLAGSPLYLKTVLEELRVSADHARLAERLEHYRAAADMPDLFNRVLMRLEADCGAEPVSRFLSLIWASRSGLEEAEIIAATGQTPLDWATLRNGLGEGLMDLAGRMVFGHDYLRNAVERRHVGTRPLKRAAHLALADHFGARHTDSRQAEELPYQLRQAGHLGDDSAWDRLEHVLLDLDRWNLLRERGDAELWSHWATLAYQGRDPQLLLTEAFVARHGDHASWSPDTLRAALQLAEFLRFAGRFGPELVSLQESTLAANERIAGKDNILVTHAMFQLADTYETLGRYREAEALLRRLLSIRELRYGADAIEVANDLTNLAILLVKIDRRGEAEELSRRSLAIKEAALGPTHIELTQTLDNLAILLMQSKRYGDAEPIFRRSLAIEEANLAPTDPKYAITLDNFAQLLAHTDRLEEAELLSGRALNIFEENFGVSHPYVATCLGNLASICMDAGRHAEAENLIRRALASDELIFGSDHPAISIRLNNLAGVLRAAGRSGEAEPLYRRALAIAEKVVGPDHPDVAVTLDNMALLYAGAGRRDEAEQAYLRALHIQEACFGEDSPVSANTVGNLAGLYRDMGRYEESERLMRRVAEIDERAFGPEHTRVALDLNNLGGVLGLMGRHEEAEHLYRRALAMSEKVLGRNHHQVAMCLNNLASALQDMGRPAEAASHYERTLEIVRRVYGITHHRTLAVERNLAACRQEENGKPAGDS